MKTKTLIAVGAVLWFAFAVRATNLDQEPLWIDETFSLWLADAPLVAGPIQLAGDDVHPPLYFALLGFWTRLTGFTELAGRYFSVLASVLSVALTCALGRRLFSAWAGVWAALALSVTGLHLRYARELRMYALLALLGVASTYAYVRWRERPTGRRAFVYWAVTAALPYTHYYGLFIPLAHTVHFFLGTTRLIVRSQAAWPSATPLLRVPFAISWRGGQGVRFPWRAWLAMQAGVALAFAPWLPTMMRQSSMRPAGLHHASPSDWPTLEWMIRMLADNQVWLVGGLAALGVLLALWRGRAETRPHAPLLLTLLWLLVPLAGGFLLNLRLSSLTLRNLIVVTPAVALMLGLGLSRLPRWLAPAAAALVAVNALTVFPALYPGNPPWRDFVRRIGAAVRPTDVVLYHLGQGAYWEPFEYYRRRDADFPVEPISLFDLPGPPSSAAFAGALARLVRDQPRVWVVTTYETPISWYAFEILTRTHSLRAHEALIDCNVYRFEPPPSKKTGYRLGDGLFTVRPSVRSAAPYWPGEAFEVEIAWDVLDAPKVDYSVGLHLVNAAFGLSAQADGYPDPRTSLWAAGETRRTVHSLPLPGDLPAGRYDVHLVVYTWWDTARLRVRDAGGNLPLGDYILLDTITVESGRSDP